MTSSPLTVDFIEKCTQLVVTIKRDSSSIREGNPGFTRMIDRPLRPSFPDGFRNEVQIVLLLPDQANAVDTISVMVHQLLWPLVAFHLRPTLRVRISQRRYASSWLTQPMKSDHSDL